MHHALLVPGFWAAHCDRLSKPRNPFSQGLLTTKKKQMTSRRIPPSPPSLLSLPRQLPAARADRWLSARQPTLDGPWSYRPRLSCQGRPSLSVRLVPMTSHGGGLPLPPDPAVRGSYFPAVFAAQRRSVPLPPRFASPVQPSKTQARDRQGAAPTASCRASTCFSVQRDPSYASLPNARAARGRLSSAAKRAGGPGSALLGGRSGHRIPRLSPELSLIDRPVDHQSSIFGLAPSAITPSHRRSTLLQIRPDFISKKVLDGSELEIPPTTRARRFTPPAARRTQPAGFNPSTRFRVDSRSIAGRAWPTLVLGEPR